MRIVVAVAGSVVLLALAAFCLFGFFATFELTDTLGLFWALRIVYAVVDGFPPLLLADITEQESSDHPTFGELQRSCCNICSVPHPARFLREMAKMATSVLSDFVVF